MKTIATVTITIDSSNDDLQDVYSVLADDKQRSELAESISQAAQKQFPTGVIVSADIKAKTAPKRPGRKPGKVTPVVRMNDVTHKCELIKIDPDLAEGEGGLMRDPIRVDSSAWWWWLEQDVNKSFRFESAAGNFTASKEIRGNSHSWVARRRVSGDLGRVHMGQSEKLTSKTLWETAHKLSQNKL